MTDIEYINTEPFGFEKGTAVALGNFDGFHLGHRAIIGAAEEYSRKNGIHSCIYTFIEHPSRILSAGSSGDSLLMTNSEKSRVAREIGVDALIYDDFSCVKNMSPSDFCKDVLIEKLNVKAVFSGENFRFGRNAEGDARFLQKELAPHGVEVFTIPFVTYNGSVISSTVIRNIIELGAPEIAEKLLGRPYSIECEVVHGMELGRKLGFPTINQLYPSEKVSPLRGVYASVCTIDGKRYAGVSNVGVKPTVTNADTAPLLCETYVIGYNGDVYGKTVKTEFCKLLRKEKKFDSLDELKDAVHKNIGETREFFGKEKRYGLSL